MRSEAGRVSPYELRVKRASDAVLEHSQLTEDEAIALVKHVLHAIDHIPERIR